MSLGSIAQQLISTAGHFELMLDHFKTNAYLKSVEGGHIKTNVVDEPIGNDHNRIKHAAVAEIEPITIETGFAGAWNLLSWIESTWKRKVSRRSGEIVHANFDLKPVYLYQFIDALILEATFPALDGSSKDPGYLKVKFQPQDMNEQKLPGIGPSIGAPSVTPMGSRQKLWSNSQFRLTIDGIPEMAFTNHIDSFTIKQGVKKMYIGKERFPHIEPTKVEFPHLSGTMAAGYTTSIVKWHDDTNRKGKSDPSVQKTGSLEFLGPDRLAPLMKIDLYEVGLFNFQMTQSTANSDTIKRVKFDLFVGRMEIDPRSKFLGHDPM
jgi:hypothetical protein